MCIGILHTLNKFASKGGRTELRAAWQVRTVVHAQLNDAAAQQVTAHCV